MSDDEKTGTTNWLKSHLAALGSAAVVCVYAAGYVRTEAAAARVADEAPSRRRPVARAPIAPAEIAETPSPRAADTKLAPAVTDVAQQPAKTPHDTTTAATAKTEHPKASAPKLQTTSADTSKAAEAHSAVTLPPAAAPAPPPAAVDTAPARSATTTQTADTAARVAYKDGVYSGWGTSRHGDIEATVDIKDGRIVSATITQCLTRYSCSWISALPPQVVDRQSAEVDYVSGATESSNAFYGAIAQALGKAK